jgi:hypothetical protein
MQPADVNGQRQDRTVAKGRRKGKNEGADDDNNSKKRRCISSACVPCRKRKSKVGWAVVFCSVTSSSLSEAPPLTTRRAATV